MKVKRDLSEQIYLVLKIEKRSLLIYKFILSEQIYFEECIELGCMSSIEKKLEN